MLIELTSGYYVKPETIASVRVMETGVRVLFEDGNHVIMPIREDVKYQRASNLVKEINIATAYSRTENHEG